MGERRFHHLQVARCRGAGAHRRPGPPRRCVDCGRGIRAMRGLVRLLPSLAGHDDVRAPAEIFDRVRDHQDPRPGR